MYAERRKNFMGQEVYRLVKAFDATTYEGHEALSSSNMPPQRLPPNHRFRNGTFILLTKQANGSGDFLTNMSLPTSYAYYKDVSAEAVVLNLGPSHLEISMAPMRFASTFGQNRDDITCQNIMQLRFRVDLFAPNVPYKRMVAALSQLTAATEQTGTNFPGQPEERKLSIEGLDEVIRNAILQTHSLTDPTSPLFGDRQVCNVEELVRWCDVKWSSWAREQTLTLYLMSNRPLTLLNLQSQLRGCWQRRQFEPCNAILSCFVILTCHS